MRPLKRAAAILYLLCCVFVLGSFACSIVGPAQERMAYLLGLPAFRIALLAATGVIAIQALYVLGLVIVWRPSPGACTPTPIPISRSPALRSRRWRVWPPPTMMTSWLRACGRAWPAGRRPEFG